MIKARKKNKSNVYILDLCVFVCVFPQPEEKIQSKIISDDTRFLMASQLRAGMATA